MASMKKDIAHEDRKVFYDSFYVYCLNLRLIHCNAAVLLYTTDYTTKCFMCVFTMWVGFCRNIVKVYNMVRNLYMKSEKGELYCVRF